MREKRPLTSVLDALSVIGREVRPLPTVRVPPSAALGMTLAETIRTDIDTPPFDKAMMDGFAVRSADCQGPGTRLRITGEIAAGGPPIPVGPGQAVRINTGAPLPPGADAVVVIENCEILPGGVEVATDDVPAVGINIARRGVDARAGTVVLEPGTRIGPAQVAAAAAAGATTLQVHERPRIAIVVTGSELVSPGQRPGPAQIRNTNGPCLAALAASAGCTWTDLGIARDDPAALSEAIHRGLEADVLCISGGVSMGQYDLVPGELERAGVHARLHRIGMKPGKPSLFGHGPRGQIVFGLPGNPVSAFVCFKILVEPALEALQGRPARFQPTLEATLEEPVPTAGARMEFLPALAHEEPPGTWRVRASQWQGSADLFGLARSNALMIREPNAAAAPAGTVVRIIPLWAPLLQT